MNKNRISLENARESKDKSSGGWVGFADPKFVLLAILGFLGTSLGTYAISIVSDISEISSLKNGYNKLMGEYEARVKAADEKILVLERKIGEVDHLLRTEDRIDSKLEKIENDAASFDEKVGEFFGDLRGAARSIIQQELSGSIPNGVDVNYGDCGWTDAVGWHDRLDTVKSYVIRKFGRGTFPGGLCNSISEGGLPSQGKKVAVGFVMPNKNEIAVYCCSVILGN